MKPSFIRLITFLITFSVGTSLSNVQFRAGDSVLDLVRLNKVPLTISHIKEDEDAKRYFRIGVDFYHNYDSELNDPVRTEINRIEKFKLAVIAFKKAIELKPDYYEAYDYLGDSYDVLHDYGLAIEAWQQASRLRPYEWIPYSSIGQAYYAFGRYGEAITYLEKANDVYYKAFGDYQGGINDSLAKAYFENGDRKNAMKQYRILQKHCREEGGCGHMDEMLGQYLRTGR